MPALLESMLESSPDVCGGHMRIAGTRITVHQIAVLDKQGKSAQAIKDDCPYLSLAQIYAALA